LADLGENNQQNISKHLLSREHNTPDYSEIPHHTKHNQSLLQLQLLSDQEISTENRSFKTKANSLVNFYTEHTIHEQYKLYLSIWWNITLPACYVIRIKIVVYS